MRTTFEAERSSPDDVLERSVAALRDAPIPPGPAPHVQAATLAALANGSGRRASSFRQPLGNAPLLARAAVLACLAAGAAAGYFVLARHWRDYSRQQPPTPTQPSGVPAAEPTPLGAGSMVTGEIRFEGRAPPPRLIDFGAGANAPEHPGGPMYDDSLLVNLDDTLQNVVVSVVVGLPEGKTYPEPKAPVVLNQVGYAFRPHVLAMRTGQPIVVRNSDLVEHDTRSLSIHNKRFNIVQPLPNCTSAIPSPREPEIFQVRCDIHPWMSAWLCAFDHPYFAVSLENGTFTLRGLPPGRYRLRAWHERLGTQECDMVVKPGRDETINFVFRLPAASPESPQAAAPENARIKANVQKAEEGDPRSPA